MTMEARARPHCPSALAPASEVPCLSFPEKHHVLLVVVYAPTVADTLVQATYRR